MIQAIRLALTSLKDHRFRTFLTTLGVVFGVAAVISMLSISDGARQEALSQFESLGIDNIVVMHRDPPATRPEDEAGPHSRGLSRGDARALSSLTQDIVGVVPLALTEQTVQGEQQVRVTVVGTTADLQRVRRDRLIAGRFFSASEEREAARVAVIGSGVVRDLCGLREPVGDFVKIAGELHEIIGVFAGGSGGGEDDQNGLLRAT